MKKKMKCRNMASGSRKMEDVERIHHSVVVGQSRIENEIEKYTVLQLAQVNLELKMKLKNIVFFSWRRSVLN